MKPYGNANGSLHIFCVVVGKVRAGEDVISFESIFTICLYSDLCKLLVTRK